MSAVALWSPSDHTARAKPLPASEFVAGTERHQQRLSTTQPTPLHNAVLTHHSIGNFVQDGQPSVVAGIEVIPHRLIRVEAPVVLARLPMAFETVPEVSVRVERAQGARALREIERVAGAQVFDDVAEA
jgi:hypothetical protein